MGEYSSVFGISLFILTLSMISLQGGSQVFEFDYAYQNATIGGNQIDVGIDDAQEGIETFFTYYDAETDKLRVNVSAVNDTAAGEATASFEPNTTGVESYIINAEVSENLSECQGYGMAYKQGLFSEPIQDGSNTFEVEGGDGSFNIQWNTGLLQSEECNEALWNSNITGIQATFPAATDIGTMDLIRQFSSADSGYQWYNYIVMGSIAVLIGYIILVWARGN